MLRYARAQKTYIFSTENSDLDTLNQAKEQYKRVIIKIRLRKV